MLLAQNDVPVGLARAARVMRPIPACRRTVVATLVFVAFTTLFGIVVHLVAELAGLGWHDGVRLLLSPRHGYLAVLALLASGSLFAALSSLPRGSRRARVAWLIAAHPLKGEGAGFAVASFTAQFAFFGITEISEGSPLGSGDVVVGILAAVGAAALGAILVSLGKRRMLDLALAFISFLAATLFANADALRCQQDSCVAAAVTRRRSPFAFRYRPPPLNAASP